MINIMKKKAEDDPKIPEPWREEGSGQADFSLIWFCLRSVDYTVNYIDNLETQVTLYAGKHTYNAWGVKCILYNKRCMLNKLSVES